MWSSLTTRNGWYVMEFPDSALATYVNANCALVLMLIAGITEGARLGLPALAKRVVHVITRPIVWFGMGVAW